MGKCFRLRIPLTAVSDAVHQSATVKAFSGANPMKHVGDVQDVANAVVYLSAPSGKFITGELLTVDGGGVLWGEVWTTAKPDYFKVHA